MPSPAKKSSRWLHYNFIISDEVAAEYKADIMRKVASKRARRQRTR
jgi:hypothetical protein